MKVAKPWGSFEQFTLNEPTTVKIIKVNPNSSISLQRHKNRREFWLILSGDGYVQLGEINTMIHVVGGKGHSFNIPEGELHRAFTTDSYLEILEISYGEFDENDIERIEDKYGRA
jgi:mannose-6-phosphate isomerase-like protein (cupin superfamily)